MKEKLTFQEAINQYLKTGTVLTETALSGNYKRGNIIAKKNRKVFDYLSQNRDLAIEVFSTIMNSDNDKAKSIAAADSIRMNIMLEQATTVLEELAKRNDFVGFEAELVLRIWKGEFPGKTL